MTSLLKIGLILVAVTFVLVLVHPADADDDVKRKRVIIKVPHRVKHIYHHHTKKVHIHKKKKPEPKKKKKPHKHVHVVVEEEEIVQPIKSWKSVRHSYKGGKTGWSDWKSSPSSLKHTIRLPGPSHTTHYEEDFAYEDDHETHESRHYGKGSSVYKGVNSSLSSNRGRKGKKKGSRSPKNFKHFEDHPFDGSYEIVHHSDYDEDFYDHDVPKRNPKTKKHKTSSFSASSSSSGYKPKKGYSRNLNKKPTRRPSFEDTYLEPEEYDELYDRGPAYYPERKEHPSWHERSRDIGEEKIGSHPRPSIWSIPNVPEVKEFIDDTKDVPDPGVTNYGSTGGFYPSNYNPITTITASVVQNSPETPPSSSGTHAYESVAASAQLPERFEPTKSIVPRPIRSKKPKKNPGYVSQVSSTMDGQPLGYKSHVGHSSDSPSSSFQSFSFGSKLTK